MYRKVIIEEITRNTCKDFNDWYEMKIKKAAHFFTKHLDIENLPQGEEINRSKNILDSPLLKPNVRCKAVQLAFTEMEAKIK